MDIQHWSLPTLHFAWLAPTKAMEAAETKRMASLEYMVI